MPKILLILKLFTLDTRGVNDTGRCSGPAVIRRLAQNTRAPALMSGCLRFHQKSLKKVQFHYAWLMVQWQPPDPTRRQAFGAAGP